MKILITTDYFPPHFGGVENVTYEISKKMALKGHEIHVLTSKIEGTPEEEIKEDIHIHRIDFFDATAAFGFQFSTSLTFAGSLKNW